MLDVKVQTLDRYTVPELLRQIVIALVDRPECVTVEISPASLGTLIRIHVHPTDIEKVIGKQGRTARSLRGLLGAASMKVKHRFSLEIEECEAWRSGGHKGLTSFRCSSGEALSARVCTRCTTSGWSSDRTPET